METRLTRADGQWKRLMKEYEDLNNTKRYISFSEPFVEMDAKGIKRIKAKCHGCNVKFSAESNNLLTGHTKCAQSQVNYDLYVASRIIDESNKPEDEVDNVDMLKSEISQLKMKVADLEDQLKQARSG